MRRYKLAVLLVFALVVAACTSGGSTDGSGSPSGGGGGAPLELTMWMGYTPPPPQNQSYEFLSLQKLVDAYNASQSDVHVTMQYVNSDFALQKVTVALQGGKAPDISYQYGTNMPQLAPTPKVVDLTDRVNDPAFNWNDFFEGERAVARWTARVLGVPALVDNLAVVYNKDLFKQAGRARADTRLDVGRAASPTRRRSPTPRTTLRHGVPGRRQRDHGVEVRGRCCGRPAATSSTPTTRRPSFNSPEGVRALTTLQQMQQDDSLYLDFHPDSGKYSELFNSGNIGMLITGPWDLSGFPDVNYGVQVMPSFDPGGSHATIAGPDNWVIFDNGQERVDAAWAFLKYLSSPDKLLADSLATGHLPTRASVEQMARVRGVRQEVPGRGHVRREPRERAEGPPADRAVSADLGRPRPGDRERALGKAEPQQALDAAAETANGILAVPAVSPDGGGDAGPAGARVRPRGRVVLRVPRRLPDPALRDRPDRLVRAALVPEDQPAVPPGVGRAGELRGAYPRSDL